MGWHVDLPGGKRLVHQEGGWKARRQPTLGPFGTLTDIGEVGRFLMSDRANWITGQTWNLDDD